jgi:hypothetical protein
LVWVARRGKVCEDVKDWRRGVEGVERKRRDRFLKRWFMVFRKIG